MHCRLQILYPLRRTRRWCKHVQTAQLVESLLYPRRAPARTFARNRITPSCTRSSVVVRTTACTFWVSYWVCAPPLGMQLYHLQNVYHLSRTILQEQCDCTSWRNYMKQRVRQYVPGAVCACCHHLHALLAARAG